MKTKKLSSRVLSLVLCFSMVVGLGFFNLLGGIKLESGHVHADETPTTKTYNLDASKISASSLLTANTTSPYSTHASKFDNSAANTYVAGEENKFVFNQSNSMSTDRKVTLNPKPAGQTGDIVTVRLNFGGSVTGTSSTAWKNVVIFKPSDNVVKIVLNVYKGSTNDGRYWSIYSNVDMDPAKFSATNNLVKAGENATAKIDDSKDVVVDVETYTITDAAVLDQYIVMGSPSSGIYFYYIELIEYYSEEDPTPAEPFEITHLLVPTAAGETDSVFATKYGTNSATNKVVSGWKDEDGETGTENYFYAINASTSKVDDQALAEVLARRGSDTPVYTFPTETKTRMDTNGNFSTGTTFNRAFAFVPSENTIKLEINVWTGPSTNTGTAPKLASANYPGGVRSAVSTYTMNDVTPDYENLLPYTFIVDKDGTATGEISTTYENIIAEDVADFYMIGGSAAKISVYGIEVIETLSEKPNHAYDGAPTTVLAPNCTDTGTAKIQCSIHPDDPLDCREVVLPALGHSYGAWGYENTGDKEATTTEEGQRSRACTVCGDRETQVIPVLDPDCIRVMDVKDMDKVTFGLSKSFNEVTFYGQSKGLYYVGRGEASDKTANFDTSKDTILSGLGEDGENLNLAIVHRLKTTGPSKYTDSTGAQKDIELSTLNDAAISTYLSNADYKPTEGFLVFANVPAGAKIRLWGVNGSSSAGATSRYALYNAELSSGATPSAVTVGNYITHSYALQKNSTGVPVPVVEFEVETAGDYALAFIGTKIAADPTNGIDAAVSGSINLYYMTVETHTWGDWNVTEEQGCYTDGEREHTCTVCEATEAEAIPARGAHKYVDSQGNEVDLDDETTWDITVNPDHTQKNTASAKCEYCDDEISEQVARTDKHTVIFKNGSTELAKVENILCGTKIVTTDLPDTSKSGYLFEGWYTDAELTKAFNPSTTNITADLTLYAKYTKVGGGGCGSVATPTDFIGGMIFAASLTVLFMGAYVIKRRRTAKQG